MGNWFKDHKWGLGLIMGTWSGNQNLGDVLGLLIGDIVVQRLQINCYYALACAAILLWTTTLSMLLIRDKPHKVVDADSRTLLNRGESD